MKKYVVVCVLAGALCALGQSLALADPVVVTPAAGTTKADALALAEFFAGAGITVVDAELVAGPNSAGSFTGDGSQSSPASPAALGYSSGLVLSSGSVLELQGENVSDEWSESPEGSGICNTECSEAFGCTVGDLATVNLFQAGAGAAACDVTYLRIDFKAASSPINLQYTFASDEYNEYVHTKFTDRMGLVLNGANCALVDAYDLDGKALAGETTFVSINTVNDADNFQPAAGDITLQGADELWHSSNPALYLNNTAFDASGSPIDPAYKLNVDGLTVTLVCNSEVNTGDEVNTLVLGVSDTADQDYNSYVFLRREGLSTQCSSAADCNDGNECTDDSCNDGVCVPALVPVGTVCTGGSCDATGACIADPDIGDEDAGVIVDAGTDAGTDAGATDSLSDAGTTTDNTMDAAVDATDAGGDAGVPVDVGAGSGGSGGSGGGGGGGGSGGDGDEPRPDVVSAERGITVAGGGFIDCSASRGRSRPGTSLLLLLGGLLLLLWQRRSRRSRRHGTLARVGVGVSVLLLVLAGGAGRANAQVQSLPLNQLDPGLASDDFFSAQSPRTEGHLLPAAQLSLDYINAPLVIRDANGDELGKVVSGQAYLRVGASLALFDRLAASLELPLAVYQDGETPDVGTAVVTSPDSAAMGDLRLGLRARLHGEADDGFQVALGAHLWLPTSPAEGFTGDSAATLKPHLIVGGRGSSMVWSLNVGPKLRFSDNPHQISYAAGVAWVGAGDALQIGPELHGGFALDAPGSVLIGGEGVQGVEIDNSGGDADMEALLGAKYRVGAWRLGLAGGPGFTDAIGNARARVLLTVAFAPEVVRDSDGDGILDPEDACPQTPGEANADPAKHGCPAPPPAPPAPPPPPDNDQDGILDVDDACPDEPGEKNEDPAKHGCPPPSDRDGDGYLDENDSCPDQPEDFDKIQDEDGCPEEDADGDTVVDPSDACPLTPGVPNGERADCNGCPKLACVQEKSIVILERVEFDLNKDTIRAESHGVLNDIVQILTHDEAIKRVRVEGHTDSQNSDAYNIDLSGRRTLAVKAWLVEKGVAAERLEAWGCGESMPVQSNKTKKGRQANRRVEFHIIDPAPEEPRETPDCKQF
ncbi:MAG: choice-of-anchor L domain-containing protein [Myxococcales bacterium]|nr:choice-of-anchor L domain-containing protein [Myxococcales bacterium]